MRVAIAGGHGQMALVLTRLLSARGDTVLGLIRNSEHAQDVRAAGGEPVLCNLEGDDDVGAAIAGSDAVVFAAGARPRAGAAAPSCSRPAPDPAAGPSASGPSTTAAPSG